MACCKDDERQPDPEIVDLEDLTPGERKHTHAQQLGDGDAAEDAPTHVDQRRPSSCVLASELVPCFLHHGSAGEHERASYMSTELDSDANADDKVDEGDGVERDIEHGHHADDVDDYHDDRQADYETSKERAKKERGEEENDDDSASEEGGCQTHNAGILVEENIELAIGKNVDVVPF